MASARLLKSLIKPVTQRHSNLVFFDNTLFFQPIGWYLRGGMFGRSRSAESVYLYRFVIPLFEPRIRGMIGWGDRLRTRAGSEGWDVEADDFLAEFEWAFETEIAAHVEAISTGEDFKLYIKKKLDFTSWGDFAIAMACLHMGQLAEAKKLLQMLVEECEALKISRNAFGFTAASFPTHSRKRRRFRQWLFALCVSAKTRVNCPCLHTNCRVLRS
jgi:hypothetical protein